MIYIAKPYIGEDEKQAVLRVLESGMLAQGKQTAELEARFAALCGVKHAIATSSGTAALHVALLAHGIGPGDEVITSSFTFIASVNSILFVGATPVFADIDSQTFNLDPAQVASVITPRTKAIMPVHLFGQACDMGALQALAEKHNLLIIEDACQAVGARYNGQVVGSFGTGCFSLYATKNVTTGEGGMITTDDDDIDEKCRMIRQHGMKRRYYHEMIGYNYRISDIHAAIGVAQMDRIADFIAKRQYNATYMNEHITSVITPTIAAGCDHVWHQYTIRLDGDRDRDQAVQQLNEAGVGTGIFYPVPAHQQPYLQEMLSTVQLPVTERMAKEVISLPVHPLVSQDDLELIVEQVNTL
ncbi:MAG: DegT/DnrJ/EryC1/StrS family aminotransferase [Anaerolineae bacterium]|nr:DegT/DnrJ/EryC1/StrS family aminotransferase [Anaerolineae bacterium]